MIEWKRIPVKCTSMLYKLQIFATPGEPIQATYHGSINISRDMQRFDK